MKVSHNRIVRGMQIFNHVLAIYGVYWAISYSNYKWLLASILVYWFSGILGINVGFHRLISHKSFNTSPWIRKVLAVIGSLTTVGSPLAWSALHRCHHMYAETPRDPHSPYQIGSIRAWFGFWSLKSIDIGVVKDLRRDPFLRWLHRYYLLVIGLYCGGLILLSGPMGVIFFYCIPACLCLHSTSAIIVIAHRHGYVSYNTEDESRNSWIANLITMGEGWHNNHHVHPGRYFQGEKWWEIDPPSWIIRFIRS